MSQSIKNLFDELIEHQRKKLYAMGRELVPTLTLDDLMQPNDYPQLEFNPLFRYEEGILEGLYTAKMALIREIKESEIQVIFER